MPFDLAAVVHEALGAVAVRAHQKDLDLVWDQDVRLPSRITADPARLRQVLVNLLGNAVKFTNVGFVRVRVGLEEPRSPWSGDVARVHLGLRRRDGTRPAGGRPPDAARGR